MAELRDDAYIVVQGWMRKLGLVGTRLLTFAAIHGFTQDGVNEYCGSQEWLASFVGVSLRCLQGILCELEKDGFIRKVARNEKLGSTNGYQSVMSGDKGMQNLRTPPNEDKEGMQNLRTPANEDKEGMQNLRTPHAEFAYPLRKVCVPKYKDENKYKNNTSEESKEDISKEYLSMLTLEELQAKRAILMAYSPATVEELDKVLNDISLYEEEIERRSPKSDIQENEESENDQTGRPEQVESKAKRYQSYDEIIKSYEFGPGVANRLKEFIRHCYAGKQFVSNERLHLLCGKLFEVWEVHPGESADEIARRQIEVINRAISGGYYDFLIK